MSTGSSSVGSSRATQPLGTPGGAKGKPNTVPAKQPSTEPKPAGPKLAADDNQIKASSSAAAAKSAGSTFRAGWEENVVMPLENAQKYWDDMEKQGGVAGAAGWVMGGVLSLSGLPSIAKNTSEALDNSKTTGERLGAAAWAAGETLLTVVPIGRLAGIGGKTLKLVKGDKVIQAVRNATKLGAEVKAGTKIVHYTNAGEKIAESGVLQGSQRGFLSMAGTTGHTEVSLSLKNGLPRVAATTPVLNNGQVYAVAADGATSLPGKVIDAIVGVSPNSTLGKIFGKISPAKTSYMQRVEHVLTEAEAAASRRWGKTIVTNVAPGAKGLAVTTGEVLTNEGVQAVVANSAKTPNLVERTLSNAAGATLEAGAKNLDLVAAGYARLMTLVSPDNPANQR